MSAPDWPALRALIDSGQARLVAAAVEHLDERQRRGLAAAVRAYARPLANDVGLDWHLEHKSGVLGARSWDGVVMYGLSTLDQDKAGDPALLVDVGKLVSA